MKKENPINKELGIVVKPEEQIYWDNIVDKCNETIKILKNELKLNEAIKEMAQKNSEAAAKVAEKSQPKDI